MGIIKALKVGDYFLPKRGVGKELKGFKEDSGLLLALGLVPPFYWIFLIKVIFRLWYLTKWPLLSN